MTEVMTLFFAVLSLVSLAGAAGIAGVMVSYRRDNLAPEIGPYALPAAASVATVATLGSLYLSEVAHFVPCLLCWIQRGFMYPLALVLWLAWWQGWANIWRWAIPWSLAGSSVSVFHLAEQHGWLPGESFCSATAPCTQIWVSHFGFVTIPLMALSGFLFVAALMWVRQRVIHAARAPTPTRSP